MIRTLSLVLAVLGLCAVSAGAQQPSQAQKNAVKSACRSDYMAHCASVPPGGQASLACLQQNMSSLSPACQTAVTAMSGGPATPAPSQPAASPAPTPTVAQPASPPAPAAAASAPPSNPPMSRRQEIRLVRGYCADDFRALCGGVQPGGGRIIACLRANAASLIARLQERSGECARSVGIQETVTFNSRCGPSSPG